MKKIANILFTGSPVLSMGDFVHAAAKRAAVGAVWGGAAKQAAQDFGTKLFTGRDAQHFDSDGKRSSMGHFSGAGGRFYKEGIEVGTATMRDISNQARDAGLAAGMGKARSLKNRHDSDALSNQLADGKPDPNAGLMHPTSALDLNKKTPGTSHRGQSIYE